jgi:GntR family transcriptional regulator
MTMVEIVRADALYKQVANVIRDEIAQGKYPPGTLLPSESAMSDRYKISRPTVRQALIALRAEGLIEVRMGKGSFVRRSYNTAAVTVDRSGIAIPVRTAAGEPVRHRRNADAPTAALLDIPENDPLFIQDHALTEDGTGRRILTRRVLPFATAEGTALQAEPFPERRELLAILAQAYGKLTAVEYVRARMPSPEETAALELADIMPLLETTLLTSAKGRPLMAETERTSAEGIQLAYPVKQH